MKISHVIFGVPLCFLISQNSFDNPCRSVSAQIQLLEKNCIKKTLRYKSMINMLGYFWKIYDTLFAKREEILQKLCNQWFFLFNFTGTFLNNALFKNATIIKPQSLRCAFEFLRDCDLGYNLLTVPKTYFVQLVKVSEGLLYWLLGPYLGPKYVSLITQLMSYSLQFGTVSRHGISQTTVKNSSLYL